MSIKDLVDVALGRYHEALDADEAFDVWLYERRQEQAAVAEDAMTKPETWNWIGDAVTLKTTKGVRYTVEEILLAALNNSEEVRTEYAELMAGQAAAKLRQLIAEHWANEMWETRSYCTISAEIAAEREDS